MYMTGIRWRFSDWAYLIAFCTYFTLKFTATPPPGINKTWEITATTEELKIKCNTLEVLHFIFNDTYDHECAKKVKGKKASIVTFTAIDTATTMLEVVGK